jgi:hypothetical protein
LSPPPQGEIRKSSFMMLIHPQNSDSPRMTQCCFATTKAETRARIFATDENQMHTHGLNQKCKLGVQVLNLQLVPAACNSNYPCPSVFICGEHVFLRVLGDL